MPQRKPDREPVWRSKKVGFFFIGAKSALVTFFGIEEINGVIRGIRLMPDLIAYELHEFRWMNAQCGR